MNAIISGLAYVLGDNVDTDQIIPAEHLAIPMSDPRSRSRYGGLAMTGVPGRQAGLPDGNVQFSDPATMRSRFSVIVAGRNFGCGSSREHAPVALAEAGVGAVVARSYARIFYRNAVDGGYFPPWECDQALGEVIATGDEVIVDTRKETLQHLASGRTFRLAGLGAAKDILAAGGLFQHARQKGMIPGAEQDPGKE